MNAGPAEPLVELTGIEKSFGGVRALRGASFSINPGEIHALLGENGAGKSTLVKILAGFHSPDAGLISYAGHDFDALTLSESSSLGIRIIYQQLSIIDHLSVSQNLVLGREHHRYGVLDPRSERRAAQAALERLGVSLDLARPAGSLRVAEKQLIEIARAFAGGEVRLILMDEPTSSLGDREVERLFNLVRALRDEGIAVVYISHKLEEVFEIADRVTVLRDGETIATVETATSTPDQLIEMMVGRRLGHRIHRIPQAREAVVLEVDDVWTATGLEAISFKLHEGEVLGIYGLLGSGRTELAHALFGADPILRGRMRLRGHPLRVASPIDAMAQGIGLVPEERVHAAFPLLSIRENMTAASIDKISRRGWLLPARERGLVQHLIDALRVRTPTAEEPLGRLSGGNQQKVIVGRWLLRGSSVLILDDPTAGIDVGAKDELYTLIGDMVAKGTSILMSSSELPELLVLADRMLVLHEGRMVGILAGDELTQRNVLRLAMGGQSRTNGAASQPAESSIPAPFGAGAP